MKYSFKHQLTLTALCCLAACGGGGGDNSILYTGQYIDAPVKGLSYTAVPSGLTGVTDEQGKFLFREGDTLRFSIKTVNGDINAGDFTPQRPSGTNSTSLLIVTDLPNGVPIAQILQSLGSNNSSGIDVGGISLTPLQIESVNNYILSGGTSSQPPIVTVSPSEAMAVTAQYVSTIDPDQISSMDILNLVSSSTLYYAGGQNETGFIRANENNTWTNSQGGAGSWRSIDGNAFESTRTYRSSNVTYSIINSYILPVVYFDGGTFIASRSINPMDPNENNYVRTWHGVFKKINTENNALSVSSVAGKKLTIRYGGLGVPDSCADGFIVYQFNLNGTAYQKRCNVGIQEIEPFISNGIASNSLPGVLKFTDNLSYDSYYMGIVSGTLSSGNLAITVPSGAPTFLQYRLE